jgi:hypothetical protein
VAIAMVLDSRNPHALCQEKLLELVLFSFNKEPKALSWKLELVPRRGRSSLPDNEQLHVGEGSAEACAIFTHNRCFLALRK